MNPKKLTRSTQVCTNKNSSYLHPPSSAIGERKISRLNSTSRKSSDFHNSNCKAIASVENIPLCKVDILPNPFAGSRQTPDAIVGPQDPSHCITTKSLFKTATDNEQQRKIVTLKMQLNRRESPSKNHGSRATLGHNTFPTQDLDEDIFNVAFKTTSQLHS